MPTPVNHDHIDKIDYTDLFTHNHFFIDVIIAWLLATHYVYLDLCDQLNQHITT